MPNVIKVADDFWNLRGSFKVAGLVDIGTHISLVRRANGNFVFLDSYSLDDELAKLVEEIVGAEKIEAILNLHPFHTIHVQKMHQRYPQAQLYGTARHHSKFPDLAWQPERTESAELHDKYASDFEFSVPAGVDFVSANQNVHFSSVLALHRASATIHSDDTLMYLRLPMLMRWLGLPDALSWHPTLVQALEKRAGAAKDFRTWAEDLIERWGEAQNLCAAHTTVLLASSNPGPSIEIRMRKALKRVEAKLRYHQWRYG